MFFSSTRTGTVKDDREIRVLANVFLQLVLTPFFHIIPVSGANQPIAALLALTALALGHRIRLTPTIVLCITTLFVVMGFAINTVAHNPEYAPAILFEFTGYLSNFISFVFAIEFQGCFSRRLIRFNIIVMLALGLLQAGLLGGAVSDLVFNALSVMIGDIQYGQFGIRGVTLFTNEPSYAAQILSLLIYLWLVIDFPHSTKWARRFYGACCCALFILCGSGTFIMLLAVGVLVYVISAGRRMILNAAILVGIIVLSGWGLIAANVLPSRVAGVIYALPLVYSATDKQQLLNALTLIGGFRPAVTIVGLMAPTVAPLGNGISQWLWGLTEVAERFGINFQNLPLSANEHNFESSKPNSFGATFCYETGVFAYLVLAILLWFVLREITPEKRRRHGWLLMAAVVTGIVQVYINGLVFLAAPWVLVALAFREDEDLERLSGANGAELRQVVPSQ